MKVYAGAMHEMPITTAPIRPTVPALRPFFERPAGSSSTAAVRGGAEAFCVRRSSRLFFELVLRVRGTTIIGTGSSCSILAAVEPRKRRRGRASRLEPTIAISPGSQSRCETASSI